VNIDNQIGTVIFSCLGLFGLWFLVFVLWDDYRQSVFRQQLFDLRGELFAYAKAGHIDFDDPNYRALRRQINSMIHYAYHVNFATLVGTIFAQWSAPDSFATPGFRERIQSDLELRPDVRDELLRIHDRVVVATATQIALTSLFAVPALFVKVMAQSVSTGAIFRDLKRSRQDLFLQEPVILHIQYMEAQALESAKQEDLCHVGAGA
jgi:hypothetical protein